MTTVNMAASVRQRLLNKAREQRTDFNLLLTRYGLERLLYRLSKSEYRNRFVLKGAMLFPLWDIDGFRTTRDIDLAGYGESDLEELKEIFRAICQTSVEDDGLTAPLPEGRGFPIHRAEPGSCTYSGAYLLSKG